MNKQDTLGYLKDLITTCISALEKQIPKKPESYGDSEDGKLLCPSSHHSKSGWME